MDVLESLEIYIPGEAEVKNISMLSLPNSVLRRMGLPLPGAQGSRKLAESPEGIWICPAVLRRKGQKLVSNGGYSVIENMSSPMERKLRAAQSPLRMSFVTSSRAAYKVLKDTMPEKKIPGQKNHISLVPPDLAPQTYQDAVVIYHGRIYLSIRKSSRSRSPRGTHEPQPASQSPIPSTSNAATQSHRKRQSPQASLEPADKEPQRKRSHVTLPQTSLKQPKDPLTKTASHSTTDQELLNDNSPKKKHTTCQVTHSENRKDARNKGRDVSSAKTARSVPQSTDSVLGMHSHCPKDAAEEAAVPEPAWFPPPGAQEEVSNNDSGMQDLCGEEAESTDRNNDMDSSVRIDSGDCDNIVGIVEQSSSQSWARTEFQGAPCASPSMQRVDFDELHQEEKIAQAKARFKRCKEASNNLHPHIDSQAQSQ